MNRIFTIVATLAAIGASVWTNPAAAWASANRFGGSTSHSYGETTHDNRYGGSSTHVAGEGTEHSNVYGGSSEHSVYGGTEHTNAYGGSTYGAYGAGAVHDYPGGAAAYHPPTYGYPAYHPPVVVPAYSSGCYGCAAAAGAVVGVAAGAAVASANTQAAASNVYAAGVAAGRTYVAPAYPIGVNYVALPVNSMPVNKYGTTYYVNGNTWFQPAYGANGVYYRVVPAP